MKKFLTNLNVFFSFLFLAILSMPWIIVVFNVTWNNYVFHSLGIIWMYISIGGWQTRRIQVSWYRLFQKIKEKLFSKNFVNTASKYRTFFWFWMKGNVKELIRRFKSKLIIRINIHSICWFFSLFFPFK